MNFFIIINEKIYFLLINSFIKINNIKVILVITITHL